MNHSQHRSAALVPHLSTWSAICLALCLSSPRQAFAEYAIEQATQSAEGLRSVLLEAGNGSARIEPSDDDQIQVRVEVKPKQWTEKQPARSIKNWFLTSSYDEMKDLLDAVRIAIDERGEGRLRIGLTPAGSSHTDRVTEEWTIFVPARMALELRMDYAEVEVVGIVGGVDIKAGAGSVRVDVPRGDVRVDLQVGDVEVKSESGSVGGVDLRSRVGKTSLWLNGMRLKYPDPPGPGSKVSVSGRGADTFRVAVEVGDVSADIDGEGDSN